MDFNQFRCLLRASDSKVNNFLEFAAEKNISYSFARGNNYRHTGDDG